jgi:adenine phosphoribosyltransferase
MFHVKQAIINNTYNSLIMNNKTLMDNLRCIPDFPKKGINFRDVTTLYQNAECLQIMLDELEAIYKDKGITKIVGIESRGFIMASALAGRLGCGVVLARKPGKLPSTVIKESFSKEYGVDTIEMHIDSINEDDVVLIHDDLLATGGTAKAAYNLVQHFHPKKVYMNFIIEIKDEGLHGRDVFKGIDLTTLLTI